MRRALLIFVIALASVLAAAQSIQHVQQRWTTDCGVAVLAMAARVPYARVDHEREALKIKVDGGMYQHDLVRLGEALKLKLAIADEKFDPRKDEGIMVIQFRGQDTANAHAVYVLGGDVYDPLQTAPQAWVMARFEWARVLHTLRVSR